LVFKSNLKKYNVKPTNITSKKKAKNLKERNTYSSTSSMNQNTFSRFHTGTEKESTGSSPYFGAN